MQYLKQEVNVWFT